MALGPAAPRVQPAAAGRGGRKMHGWEAMAGAVAVAVAVASLLVQLRRGTRRDADAIFAVVSGSLAMSLMAPWLGAAPAWMQWAVLVGASATCNGYWLLDRKSTRLNCSHVKISYAVFCLKKNSSSDH